ncbi:MAG TPA: hypothetical protein VGM76_06605 [Lacipirellulaceae bacterium]
MSTCAGRIGWFALVAWVLAQGGAALAIDWKANVSGNFNTGTNWVGGVAPTSADTAAFGVGPNANYTVTLNGAVQGFPPVVHSVDRLVVGANTVSLARNSFLGLTSLAASNNTLTESGRGIVVGQLATGTATLNTSISITGIAATIADAAGSVGTWNMTSNALTLSGATNTSALIVGNDGAGTLNISGGASVNLTAAQDSLILGKNTGASGTVAVSGNGSRLVASDAASSIVVGNASVGSLTVSNGGLVNEGSAMVGALPGGTGSINVTGTAAELNLASGLQLGSSTSQNGFSGSGSLDVSVAGQVAVGGDAAVGSAGSGAVTVAGSGSTWSVGGQLKIRTKGSLDITGGAQVSSGRAIFNGDVNIGDAGSAYSTNDYLDVGGPDDEISRTFGSPVPTLNVTGGGQVNNRFGLVGASSVVTIDGAGSAWNSAEQLLVGLGDDGQFSVTGSGHATSGSSLVGVLVNSAGTVSIDGAGSSWNNSGDVAIGVAGTGRLAVSRGAVVTVGGLLSVGPRGTIEGNSQIAGAVRNEGIITPGLSTSLLPTDALGTLHVGGDYTQTATGTLQLQIDSTTSYDKLVIDGSANLSGTLNVLLIHNFIPTAGDTFDLLTATGGMTGSFTLELPLLLAGLHGPFWNVTYTNTDVILKLTNSPTGDYNHNGIVDAADYAVWRDTLGKSGINLAADGDGDHDVDIDDFNVWKSNFGMHAGSGSGTIGAIPEPGTLVLILLGMVVLAARSGREWYFSRWLTPPLRELDWNHGLLFASAEIGGRCRRFALISLVRSGRRIMKPALIDDPREELPTMDTTIPAPAEWVETIGELRLPSKTDLRLQQLMDRNTEGELSLAEREELEALVELSERLSLVRAEALQLLGRGPR